MNSILFRQSSTINKYDFHNIILVDINIDVNKSIDVWMDEFVKELLQANEYKNILIPLTFGNVLSDFLGLRLALHIRTTNTTNRNKNIFIYGTESMQNLINHDFFSILKTKGIFIIDYNLNDIKKSLECEELFLEFDEIPKELKKVDIKIPDHLFDSHSVANSWGMFRLLELANLKVEEIKSISFEDQLNVYFKYMNCKNNKLISEDKDIKEINYEHKNLYDDLKNKIKNAPKIDLSKFNKKR